MLEGRHRKSPPPCAAAGTVTDDDLALAVPFVYELAGRIAQAAPHGNHRTWPASPRSAGLATISPRSETVCTS
ncbi:MAG: hypothetical protein MSC31_09375 [Solirubrobacteraceae bacterium MAG38_C4-C5]|nr:hypothetical protein [Candidatus Siliceabacter maunaloa]